MGASASVERMAEGVAGCVCAQAKRRRRRSSEPGIRAGSNSTSLLDLPDGVLSAIVAAACDYNVETARRTVGRACRALRRIVRCAATWQRVSIALRGPQTAQASYIENTIRLAPLASDVSLVTTSQLGGAGRTEWELHALGFERAALARAPAPSPPALCALRRLPLVRLDLRACHGLHIGALLAISEARRPARPAPHAGPGAGAEGGAERGGGPDAGAGGAGAGGPGERAAGVRPSAAVVGELAALAALRRFSANWGFSLDPATLARLLRGWRRLETFSLGPCARVLAPAACLEARPPAPPRPARPGAVAQSRRAGAGGAEGPAGLAALGLEAFGDLPAGLPARLAAAPFAPRLAELALALDPAASAAAPAALAPSSPSPPFAPSASSSAPRPPPSPPPRAPRTPPSPTSTSASASPAPASPARRRGPRSARRARVASLPALRSLRLQLVSQSARWDAEQLARLCEWTVCSAVGPGCSVSVSASPI
eukprot:tig00020704_g13178.t1